MTDKQELPKKYLAAKAEAERFLDRFEDVAKRFDEDERFRKYLLPIAGSKEVGALKRSSLDLTRALAEFRKP